MKNKFLKLIATISIVLLSITSLAIADDHVSNKEIVSELKKQITELGEKPKKRKAFQGNKKYIVVLKEQKNKLEKEKAKRAKIDAAKEEIIPELLQSNCNANNILKRVSEFIENPDKIKNQIGS